MGRKRNRRELEAVSGTWRPVRLVRTLDGAERMDGFVLDVERSWVLIHRMAGLRLDGWTAIRLDTIRRVERRKKHDVMARALGGHDERPEPVGVDLTGPAEIIRSMARLAPLVTLHREVRWPDECYIGCPTRYTNKKIDLLEIDPQAHWEPAPRRFGLRRLTRIEIGGDYERTLSRVGGPPPEARPPQ